uniref:Putative E3 ubiquitin-protein ligase ARI4 n=1 Tax=Lygus hesperus TaxID=30085 RepID=A0A0A9XZB9_LYGHE
MRVTTTAICSIAAVTTLTIFLFPSSVSAIYCFQCNSQFDDNCAHIAPNDTSSPYYRRCQDEEYTKNFNGTKQYFCRKIVQKIYDREGLTRVVRRCGWVPHKLPCYGYNNKGHEDIVCQCFTDACNAATSIAKSWPITLLSSVSVLLAIAAFK